MSHDWKPLKVRAWRQAGPTAHGHFVEYTTEYIDDMSFLEMLDVLNEQLIKDDEEPIAFDFDCREGICGSCGMMINGVPHGPIPGITSCQLHMRHLDSPTEVTIEPWRAGPFPVIRDLVVDRTAFDTLMEAGGYVSVDTGGAPDANEIPISKTLADEVFDFAACIGCGACVAACKNAAANLFVGAKVSQFALLPQGQVERERRAWKMVNKMADLGFGTCSNEGECEAVCPKAISTDAINLLNREYIRATIFGRDLD